MNPKSREIYNAAVCSAFAFLKRTARLEELFAKAIPLEGEGVLLPICDLHTEDESLVATLSKWRAENQGAYPTRFPVTVSGTRQWLQKALLETEDRILFLVLDKYGAAVGHLGFANGVNSSGEMEVDNVVRGVKGTAPGLMLTALKSLTQWARNTIGVEHFALRVFEENEHAIRFYKRAGFSLGTRIPLRRRVDGTTESFTPILEEDSEPPDAFFLRMQFAFDRPPGSGMILTAGPSVGEREAFYAWDAARNGWNSKWSGYLTAFETAFAAYIGVKHCMVTSSCTGALHISLAALGIGPGDEVIVPDITWVATANAVLYVGATPVFADVEEDSWCLSPASFESKITPRTRAVIPVHLYGHPARMCEILEIARQHELNVVEDAAPAIGAEWQGKRTGTFGDFACFSFQGAKLLVTGEGGALVTNDTSLYERALKIWDQGRDPSKTFWIDQRGLKYKMSNVQAAVGLAQIERCDEQIEMKRRIFEWYREGLSGCPHLSLMPEIEGARSIYWMSNCRLHKTAPVDREGFRAELKRRKIDTRPVFPAISQYPIWQRDLQPQSVAYRVGQEGVNLPSGVRLTRGEIAYVCENIQKLLR
jgi:perosamine synthetase